MGHGSKYICVITVTYPETTAPVTLATFPKCGKGIHNRWCAHGSIQGSINAFRGSTISGAHADQLCLIVTYLNVSTETLSWLQAAQLCSASDSGSELQQTSSTCTQCVELTVRPPQRTNTRPTLSNLKLDTYRHKSQTWGLCNTAVQLYTERYVMVRSCHCSVE